MKKGYLDIVAYYEKCLEKHGDTHLGVDWPRLKDVQTRYRVMLDIIRPARGTVKLLDFGCGASHLYEYMKKERCSGVEYLGLDLSSASVSLSKKKYPRNRYFCLDILKEPKKLPVFDYAVMNGVYTQKRDLSQAEMFTLLKKQVRILFSRARRGVAFNVMSGQVDWKRKEAFHLDFDDLASFLSQEVSRNFTFRHDYGLYEFTAYIYK